MRLLALDTSSDACTVAVKDGDALFCHHETAGRIHTSRLMPMIRASLEEAGLGFDDLDAIVLGNGPGSFIGMRIAASVAQGIAFAARLPVVPVSSMAALAVEVFEKTDAAFAAIAQDAHMQEVYFGLYRRSPTALAEPVAPERLAAQAALAELEGLDPDETVAAGAGWQRYPELAARNSARVRVDEALIVPHASHVVRLGAVAFGEGRTIAPEAVDPAYLRQKVASVPTAKST